MITKEWIKAHNRRVRRLHAMILVGAAAVIAWVIFGLTHLGILLW